jgi:hypothetical protein
VYVHAFRPAGDVCQAKLARSSRARFLSSVDCVFTSLRGFINAQYLITFHIVKGLRDPARPADIDLFNC